MLIKAVLIALAAATFTISPAEAAPTVKVSRTLVVHAAPDQTFDAIKDFGGWQSWHPAIEKTDIKSGGANKVGTVRVLSLKGGGTITETLTAFSARGKSYSYRIDESPLPVTNYRSTLAVKSGKAGGSTLTWSSTFKAKQGVTDAEAKKAIEGVYDTGLDNLKTQLGG